ncbi:shikimate dehydrogenase [Ornithinibacillus halophilus]|uniref:Shikimate dehydrogenase (NADP(+)) n=1 Tax=Ornithinibacillus halophilus TaxID=930117 RepID=A0A1M5DKI9_9BACI|nr:shikimate dehydrogenase [Ornithinibacillus halophilus]SHF67272.1 shikimate dehydrogenase [Ornithinibacillus halophilus]
MQLKLGLIGYPITHSLSPWIHRQFLDKTNSNGTYDLYEIKPEDFDVQIKEFLQSNLDGFNVTVPFKQKIIPYLDYLDRQADEIGAVNTVRKKNGKWVGYNTDGLGYVNSLQHHFPDFFKEKSKRIVILGAGGAARSIYFALNQFGFSTIDLANRTMERATSLLELKSEHTSTSILSIKETEEVVSHYDLVIQTTSVGMKPYPNNSIIQLDHVKQGSIFSDIVYQPIFTNFLQLAQQKGAQIHYGHTMLLYQAKLAFELWSNHKVPMEGLEDTLKNILEG